MKIEVHEDLHQCQTFNLNDRVKKVANELGDHELLAKFSAGDMIATEPKYHVKCLNELNNRYRASKSNRTENEEQHFIEGNFYQTIKLYT